MATMNRRMAVSSGFISARSAILGLAQVAFFFLRQVSASPLPLLSARDVDGEEPEAEGADLVVLGVASLVLVLAGGAFAGLTIAFMGQDNIHLQVLINDGKETPTPAKVATAKNAQKVLNLLNKGKHWVLVTLLLSNVIVNETLPVVLDRCLGGGVAAVIGSTVLIVIFGEILPQSVCVRYGLPIGGFMAFPVLVMMWVMAPIGWPIAKLLDWVLGKHEGTIYKKSGLKTLVALHGTIGESGERLNTDEVTIIRAVLDLRAKEVGAIMTPMADVFTLSADTVLDEDMMEHILTQGYSRIPIHAPDRKTDFVGMLLVKILITYDPEDAMRVRDFPLAALPETTSKTSCLDILNYFQVGKSHMAVVSTNPGESHGALGVVTLEDVIEELIGEEIIDESDVYVDIHKAIRRITPAPKIRYGPRRDSGLDSTELPINSNDPARSDEVTFQTGAGAKRHSVPGEMSSSPKTVTFMMRRGSSGGVEPSPVPVKAKMDELKQHLKHLGPSNPAANPKSTNSAAVTIKKTIGNQTISQIVPVETREGGQAAVIYLEPPAEENEEAPEADEDTPLLGGSQDKTKSGKGGVRALRKSYSEAGRSDTQQRLAAAPPTIYVEPEDDIVTPPAIPNTSSKQPSPPGSISQSLSMSAEQPGLAQPNNHARSGSITESVVETGGIRKVVITTSSGDEDDHMQPPQQLSPAASYKGESNGKDAERMDNVEDETGEVEENGDEEQSHKSPIEPGKAGESSNAGDESVSAASPPTDSAGGQQEQAGAGKKSKNNKRKKKKNKF